MPSIAQASSPLPASQPLANEAPRPQYSPALPLPSQLLEHIKIYLEERLYTQSITLLLQTLTANVSNNAPVHIPPPHILALIGTLAIHPSLTSQDGEKTSASHLALHYLNHLNTISGPVHSKLDVAFRFNEPTRRTRKSGGRRSDSARYGCDGNDEASDEQDETAGLQGKLANADAVWNRGLDFWALLGWTLNCASVAPYTERWIRWKLWMDMLLQVLEADWAERLRLSEEQKGAAANDEEASKTSLADSLVVQYIGASQAAGPGGLRRILRAVFASGTQKDLTEFGEVWPGETKKRRKKELKMNTKGMNVEEGEFGDYFDSDSDASEQSDGIQIKREDVINVRRSGPRRSNGSKRKPGEAVDDEPETSEAYGGHEAIALRKRILILLTKVAAVVPDHFVTHDNLLDVLEESTRSLPRPVFAAIFTQVQASSPASRFPPSSQFPPASRFPPSTHISMLQEFARPLLIGSGAPKSRSYFLTQDKLEKEYLPFASGTGSSAVAGGSGDIVVDNAKLSLCLEAMIRILFAETGLDGKEGGLRKVFETGMKARRRVVDFGSGDRDKKRKLGQADGHSQALQMFDACEARTRVLLTMIETCSR